MKALKRKAVLLISAALLAAFLLPCFPLYAGALSENPYVRIGLFYGTNTLIGANLENADGGGAGYRFGFFDDSYNFTELASTSQTQITMFKNSNVYISGSSYSDSPPSGSYLTVGAWHLQLGEAHGSYPAAAAAASLYQGAFVSWIQGSYYVRLGSYTSAEAASAALASLGLSGCSVKGGSATAVTVTQTKTNSILFQFDGGGVNSLVVMPGRDDAVKTVTWFKGFRYHGCFQYKRMSGGNLTVINVVRMEDYVKGILPYEMNAAWPAEALKAQAVAARTYAACSYYRHSSQGFDLCNGEDCQVYQGLNLATAASDAAVDATYNTYVMYDGKPAITYYHASNGGATEDCANIWGTKLEHIKGVADPHEALVADKIGRYYWSTTYTTAELTARLNERGQPCSSIQRVYVSSYTPTGNPGAVTFVDSAGKSVTLSGQAMFAIFTTAGKGIGSYRFTVASGGTLYVNQDGGTIGGVGGAYVLDGAGSVSQYAAQDAYVIDGSGGVSMLDSGKQDGQFTLNGSGRGHNLGMSQWGAYSMAEQGYTYDQILRFYYTGITLEPLL